MEPTLTITKEEASRTLDWYDYYPKPDVRANAALADKLWAFVNDEGECKSP